MAQTELLFIQPDDEPQTTVAVDLESIIWAKITEPAPDNPKAKQHIQIGFSSGKDMAFTGQAAKYLSEVLVKRRHFDT
jgi:hypothetical protein